MDDQSMLHITLLVLKLIIIDRHGMLLCCSEVLCRNTIQPQHSSRVLSKIMSYPLAAAQRVARTRASRDSIDMMATLWPHYGHWAPQGHGLSILAVMAQ